MVCFRSVVLTGVLAVSAWLWLGVGVAEACPSCATAVQLGESDQDGDVAGAFGYTIYLLMSLPFIIFGFFATMGWRLHQQALREQAQRRSGAAAGGPALVPAATAHAGALRSADAAAIGPGVALAGN